jgi:small subunit ribosomal protein S14
MAKKAWLERLKKEPKFLTRVKHRCQLCGRSRSYIRKFAICRICFRKLAHQGELPGVTKSSW